MAPPRRTFQPIITSSSWRILWSATAQAATRRRGESKAADNTLTPNLTNGDMLTLVKAWFDVVGATRFGFWYQFAASAYGWDPTKADKLDTGPKQRDAMVDVEVSHDLWVMTLQIALDADGRPSSNDPVARLEFESNAFDDPVFQGKVRKELLADGAKAEFKIPVACRDKSGRKVSPKLQCRDGFDLERVPGTTLFVCRNRKTGESESPKLVCENPVLVEDPISAVKTDVKRLLVGLLLILGVAYVVKQELDNN